MTHTILAIDPGYTTGACLAIVDNNSFRVLKTLELLWSERFAQIRALIDDTYLSNRSVPSGPVTVIVENFRLRQGRAFEQSGSDFPSSQVIGIVGSFLFIRGSLSDMILQEPIVLSRVLVQEEDKEWIIGSPHKLDAYRHARYYFATELYVLKRRR